MAENTAGWMGFLLKDRFSTNEEKTRLAADVCRCLGRPEEDVWWIPLDENPGLGYYFFVRERTGADNEIDQVTGVRRECFEARSSHVRFGSDEMDQMMRSQKHVVAGKVKFGDVVKIRRGTYSDLHGVVLREAGVGKVFVGLKFCFGTVVEAVEERVLDIEGNVFNYIKVLK